MEQRDIQTLLDLPIESVATRLGLKVERHIALCPFHDDHNASLHFNRAKNRYRCYVCGAFGRTIDLAMKMLGKGFVETCRWLADEGNIIIREGVYPEPVEGCSKKEYVFNVEKYVRFFEHPYLNRLACDFLFGQRKLHPAVIDWCRLNSYGEWLQIPYFDINGNLIGIQFRNLGRNAVGEPAEPRFKFPSGSQCHIYNLPILRFLSPGEELYIAEGCSDCWALMSAGHKAIAIPSATLLNVNETGILKGLNLQMYPDQDTPGEQLYLQLNNLSPVIRHQLPTGCKDYSDYFVKMLIC